jgi:hypothetical protein
MFFIFLATYSNEKTKQKYMAFVNKTFSKGENIIKLMGFDNVHFMEKFETMMENATIQDLEKILQVRGGKKS